MPFDKLYNLAQNCANQYYSKVTQTLIDLIKHNQADRQIILINTARVLKYLETYGQRQSKLWKILQKYDQLPDNFEALKMQLSTDFKFLKEATSKNFENLQQSYTTTLCGNVNLLYSKLAKIEVQIQKQGNTPVPNLDEVQLDALEYDPDIDEPLIQKEQLTRHSVEISAQDIPSPPESTAADAPCTEEDITGRDWQDNSEPLQSWQ